MSDILIEHTHEGGSLVHGTTRTDGTRHVFAATGDGWRFSRTIGPDGAWYLPRTRDRNADRSRLDRLATALRGAGHTVQVQVDDTRRDPAVIEADRDQRSAGRVARYTELADARHHRGQARLDHVQQRRSAIPLGQPVISDRYAGFLRRLNRSEDIGRADLAVGDHYWRRARAAESTLWHRHNARVTTRRIERLQTEQRVWQRNHDTSTDPEYQARAAGEIERLDAAIWFWRSELARLEADGVYTAWTREHFRVGDEARIGGTWYPVRRVNAKTVTVPPLIFGGVPRTNPDGSDVWTDRAPYDKVFGRRRNGTVLHTPPPPAGTVCTERIVVPAVNPEITPDTDGGPCAELATARVSIHHDGQTCGCDWRCLEWGPDTEPEHAWTEVLLWCTAHAHEYRPHLDAITAAVIYEVWT